jgi:hypothetical protein
MGGREEDKEIEEGASGWAFHFSLGWCLHPGRKGALLSRV